MLQNLTFHISLQEIQQEDACSGRKKKLLLEVPTCRTAIVMLKRRRTMRTQGQGQRSQRDLILQTRRVHALERNLCLGWGWGCDLIQKIFWQPVLLRVSPRPDSSWHVSFLPPRLSAARPHHYCLLICLFIYLFLIPCFLFHASHPLTLAVWIPVF